MAAGKAPSKVRKAVPVKYDADQKMLAFAGTLCLFVGSLFWGLLGARTVMAGEVAGGLLEIAVGAAGALSLILAWGLRVKMDRGVGVSSYEVSRLMAIGAVAGVLVGFLVYLALRFKLEDPGVYNVVAPPEDVDPALR